jgi:hypothetical protein
MLERDVEKYLVKRVEELGGEIRKVKWVGRSKAPDRLVMLPPLEHNGKNFKWRKSRTYWVELKKPGGLATFPKNAHERGQQREHERMRAVGQRVVVIDSIEGVDGLLS